MDMRRFIPAFGGHIPGPWIAGTWTRDPATGLWTNPGIVPGANVIVDGPFDTDIGAGNWSGANWVIGATGVATHTPGAGTELSNVGGAAAVVGKWYRLTVDFVSMTVSGGYMRYGGSLSPYYTTIGSKTAVVRATTTIQAQITPNLNTWDGVVDNYTAKPLALSELIAYRNYGRQVSIASALTMTAGIPGGVVSRLSVNEDGTFNFVHCWHDGTRLHLDTVVNSTTVVSKVNATAAYGATKAPKINFPSANVAQALYGPLGSEVQIGTDQDISAVPAGTYAGLFSTDSTVTLGDPVIT